MWACDNSIQQKCTVYVRHCDRWGGFVSMRPRINLFKHPRLHDVSLSMTQKRRKRCAHQQVEVSMRCCRYFPYEAQRSCVSVIFHLERKGTRIKVPLHLSHAAMHVHCTQNLKWSLQSSQQTIPKVRINTCSQTRRRTKVASSLSALR